MMGKELRIKKGQKLFFLFLLFLVLITFPVLSIFNTADLVFGFPVLFIYLFLVWLVFIGLLFFTLNSNKDETETDE